MESIVQNLLSGQQKVKAAVPTPKVHIENDVATVSSETHVESPVKATIAINCKLGNDVSPQRLKLIQSDIQEKAGPLDKLKLKAVNVEHRVQKTLSDPNQALRTALENQLQPRGARLTDTALHLHKQTLAINLKGGPVGTSK
jgi:predicted component of type VI protein secretion system